MTDRETIAVYDAKADDYADLTAGDAQDPALIAFIGSVPAGGAVLDLGCGPGHAAARMAAQGLQVEAIDASASMVALAAAQPGVAARQAGFDSLDAQAAYHGIWANFSLLHAPRDALPGHLRTIARALVPGGSFHIAMKLGKDSARDAMGRFYTYVQDTELHALVHEAGFAVHEERRGTGRGLDGSLSDWISLLCRRVAPLDA